jgi:hypothetical protein
MSPSVNPSPWLAVPIVFGLFFGGGYLGEQVSRVVAPGSGLAEFVSFLAFPMAFVLGFVAWAGASIPGAVRRLVSGSAAPDKKTGANAVIPPGSWAFIPAALVIALVAGAVVGTRSPSPGFGWVLCLYGALGLSYGVACWLLARTGCLPFPRE